jgi:hypothetical protein
MLQWLAEQYVDIDYSVSLHLVDLQAGDQLVAQGDAPPLNGRWPTSMWRPGVAVEDVHTVALPAGMWPGSYDLLVGLYDPATGERLRLTDGRDAVRLSGVQVP